MANISMSKYKLKIFSYRLKSFMLDIIGRKGERRRARVFSIFAVLVFIALVASISVYGLNLKGGATNTKISSTSGDTVILRFLQISAQGNEPLLSTMFGNYGEFDYKGTRYLMVAKTILLTDFNANPTSYNLSKYDGVVFGFTNGNGGIDLNDAGLNETISYINTGKPMIFGHDTIVYLTNFSKLKHYIGITSMGLAGGVYQFSSWPDNFSPNVDLSASSTDTILNGPYTIPYNVPLLSVETHTGTELYYDDAPDSPAWSFTDVENPSHSYYYPSGYPDTPPDIKHYFCQSATTYIQCYINVKGRFMLSAMGDKVGLLKDIEQKIYINALFTAYQNSNPPPITPAPTGVTNVTYDGVSIHTKARNISRPEAAYSATAKKGLNDIIEFTLTVSNAGNPANTDVKFDLPAGFSYLAPVSGQAPSQATGATGTLTWPPHTYPTGESTIIFTTKAP
jgi:uncharacterized repeat protein (TIGR01451 family)